jgi:hypothetical protein
MIPAAHAQTSDRPHLCEASEIRPPLAADERLDWMDQRRYFDAWHALEADFVRRVEDGELHLTGVHLNSNLTGEARVIPPWLASSCHFRFGSSTLYVRKVNASQRFAMVRVSRHPPDSSIAVAVAAPASKAAHPPIDALTARKMSDEELLVLLEENVRRIVEEYGSTNMKLPGRESFIPLLHRKMVHRFKVGEACLTLAEEAAALEAWLKARLDGHHFPSVGQIENKLRAAYNRLKAASTTSIQKSKA